MRRTLWALGAAALLFMATTARADDERRDTNLFLRGGVSTFTGELGALAAAGPSYGVTLNVQPYNLVGFEVGYEGSRNGVVGERASGRLVRNGVSAMVKVAPPFVERVKPFVAAGLGASVLSLRSGGQAQGNDVIQEVPLAAGLEFNSGRMTAGMRATYRALVGDALGNRIDPGGAPDGGLFDAAVTLGARF